MPNTHLSLVAVTGLPLLKGGDDLGALLADALASQIDMCEGDVLVVTQKAISKCEGCIRLLDEVQPGEQARALARVCGKPPPFVQAVLDESTQVIRCTPGVLITRHRLGHVMANAGIDQSNVEHPGGRTCVALLPEDPDRSARALRSVLRARFGVDVAILVSDSFGRPWRIGTTGVCVGAAGLSPIYDLRGNPDLFGRALEISQQAVADELAGAASLLMGQGAEGIPAVLVRGFSCRGDAGAAGLLRVPQEDLFQ